MMAGFFKNTWRIFKRFDFFQAVVNFSTIIALILQCLGISASWVAYFIIVLILISIVLSVQKKGIPFTEEIS